jgi:hypothetical protein
LHRLILRALITPRQQQVFQIVRNVTTSKHSVRNLGKVYLLPGNVLGSNTPYPSTRLTKNSSVKLTKKRFVSQTDWAYIAFVPQSVNT